MASDSDWARRIGATEGTGLGFLAGGAIMGMVWLGSFMGTELPIDEGGWAALFLAMGAAILLIGVGRAEE